MINTEKIKQAVKLFLVRQGWESKDYSLIPLNDQEIHIRPSEIMPESKFETILLNAQEKGFTAKIVMPDPRCSAIKELAFSLADYDKTALNQAFPEIFIEEATPLAPVASQETDDEFQMKYEG